MLLNYRDLGLIYANKSSRGPSSHMRQDKNQKGNISQAKTGRVSFFIIKLGIVGWIVAYLWNSVV